VIRMGRTLGLGLALWGLCACEAEPPEPRFYKEKDTLGQTASAGKAKSAERKRADALHADNTAAAQPKPARHNSAPSSADPLGGKFSLKQAVEGLPKAGKLHASIETGRGTLDCLLYDDKAPLTVANFVGLARGVRPFWDASSAAWVKRPLYDGTTFHRVIPGFMIQGGDHLGNGTGDVGYNVPDEIWSGSNHDRAGLLCMANKGPNTNGGQFFITDAAAPHLTEMKTYTIFGECKPVDVVHEIANSPKAHPGSESPNPPIPIQHVTISRR
jgi:peptidyl-prolyl cis-trans isomerase A (cyclophilin A)